VSTLGRAIETEVRVSWSALREEAAWAALPARRRRRTARRVALGCTLAMAAFAAAIVMWPASATHAIASSPAPVAHAASVAPTAPATPTIARPAHTAIELERGTRELVADATTGPIEAHGGGISVEAVQAVFECSRSEHAMRVEVFRGSVMVRAAGQQHRVDAGEHAEFHDAPAPAPPRPPAATWRDLARNGDFDRAYAAFDHVSAGTEDLLMSADVMRLSHHPAEAVAPLQRVVREHAEDPRASLAAFTLGRVLLDELGRPRDAADAFADAIRLAPDGPLVEDALAREVEALSRAGEPSAARKLADDYVRRFPSGRKTRSVRSFGGIE
jgi:transmembrane sensor